MCSHIDAEARPAIEYENQRPSGIVVRVDSIRRVEDLGDDLVLLVLERHLANGGAVVKRSIGEVELVRGDDGLFFGDFGCFSFFVCGCVGHDLSFSSREGFP